MNATERLNKIMDNYADILAILLDEKTATVLERMLALDACVKIAKETKLLMNEEKENV